MSITKLSLLLSHYNVNIGASLLAQMVKNLPATWETWIQSLEDSLEEGMAITSVFFFFFFFYFSILTWRIPWTEEPGGLQSMGSQKSWTRLNN